MDLSDKIIIFLDIDGVLNNMKTQYAWFDKHAINVLNYVTKKYHAKIVISSSDPGESCLWYQIKEEAEGTVN